MLRHIYLIVFFFFLTINAQSQNLNEKISFDNEITKGQLGNGLTYYFKENSNPEGKAFVKIIVKAGSLMEREDQLGLAHLLEHMLFNGTKSYPKENFNEYFSSIGLKLGADFNAYTEFETTSYYFDVPTTDLQVFEKGIHIISEMMFAANLEDEYFERERKIVEEEWRRSLDKSDRIYQSFKKSLYQNSLFANRDPIGDIEVIRNFNPKVARDFYDEWYQPNHMALLIVGDIKQDKVMPLIEKYFSVPLKPSNQIAPNPALPPYGKSLFVALSDEEQTDSSISIYNKALFQPTKTLGDYRQRIILDFIINLVDKRIASISDQTQSPLIAAGIGQTELTSASTNYYSYGTLQDDNLLAGTQILLEILETIKQNGFIVEELENEKTLRLKHFQQSLKEAKTIKNETIVSELSRNFLEEEFVSGIQREYEYNQLLLPNITIEDLNQTFKFWFNDEDRIIVFLLPELVKTKITEEDFFNLEQSVKTKQYPQYASLVKDEPLIVEDLKGSKIIEEKYDAKLAVTEITLENGIKALIKTSDFESQIFSFYAKSLGGSSYVKNHLIAINDLFEEVAAVSDLGNFSRVELSNKIDLSATNVSLILENYYEGIEGASTVSNMKELFELIYLNLTSLKFKEEALDKIKQLHIDEIKKENLDPKAVFFNDVVATLYQNHKRARSTTIKQVQAVRLKDIQSFYKDRFGNPSDFVFSFVGDFTLAEIKPFIITYLGSLPGKQRKESFIDHNVRYEDKMKKFSLKRNLEQNSVNYRIYTNPFTNNVENRFRLYVFEYVLDRLLFERVREEKGLVYSINSSIDSRFVPLSSYSIFISFSEDPKNNEIIFNEIDAVLKDLADKDFYLNFLEEAKLNKVKETEQNLRKNSFIQSALTDYYLEGQPLETLLKLKSSAEAVQIIDIQNIAKEIINDNYIKASLLPK